MSRDKAEVTVDLGLIKVVTTGPQDVVYLARDGVKLFTLICDDGSESRLVMEKQLYECKPDVWDAVFHTYSRWKRSMLPQVQLAAHEHPWKRRHHKRPELRPPAI